jgi:hypothetical protein
VSSSLLLLTALSSSCACSFSPCVFAQTYASCSWPQSRRTFTLRHASKTELSIHH